MTKHALKIGDEVVIKKESIRELLNILQKERYETIGPIINNGAIIYDDLESIFDFPIGWNDVQQPGIYRLKKSDSKTLFGYAVGPHPWKKFLHLPAVLLWQAKRNGAGFKVFSTKDQIPKYAFIGVRPCDLNAIAIHDRVFNNGKYSDPLYNSRRKKVFIVAVNCTRPGGTCFCVSMKAGPKIESGFDIALTEVMDKDEHYFLAEAGSQMGAKILGEVTRRKARDVDKAAAEKLLEKSVAQMGRTLDTSNLRALFREHFEDPGWEDITERCLTCGNCTMVCPTCFCTNVEDANSLDGDYAERWRKWDSCFSKEFSYIHGGSIRFSEKARYRQWMIHKLVTWVDQFETFGCVGCGRCITWCPVGIDIKDEAKAILKGKAGVNT